MKKELQGNQKRRKIEFEKEHQKKAHNEDDMKREMKKDTENKKNLPES